MLSVKGGGIGGVKRYMSLAGLRWSNYDLKCWTDAVLYFYFQRCENIDFLDSAHVNPSIPNEPCHILLFDGEF